MFVFRHYGNVPVLSPVKVLHQWTNVEHAEQAVFMQGCTQSVTHTGHSKAQVCHRSCIKLQQVTASMEMTSTLAACSKLVLRCSILQLVCDQSHPHPSLLPNTQSSQFCLQVAKAQEQKPDK